MSNWQHDAQMALMSRQTFSHSYLTGSNSFAEKLYKNCTLFSSLSISLSLLVVGISTFYGFMCNLQKWFRKTSVINCKSMEITDFNTKNNNSMIKLTLNFLHCSINHIIFFCLTVHTGAIRKQLVTAYLCISICQVNFVYSIHTYNKTKKKRKTNQLLNKRANMKNSLSLLVCLSMCSHSRNVQ